MFGSNNDAKQQAVTADPPQVVAPDPASPTPIDENPSFLPPIPAADDAATAPVADAVEPVEAVVAPAPAPVSAPSVPAAEANSDLLALKQHALQQLSPLVGHLEQSPEEKFKTIMMMIQAADDQSMIKVAYDTAQEIEDEKVRAQALLDIVNEINYFTQKDAEV